MSAPYVDPGAPLPQPATAVSQAEERRPRLLMHTGNQASGAANPHEPSVSAPYVGPGKLPFLGENRPSGAPNPHEPSGGAPYVGPGKLPFLGRSRPSGAADPHEPSGGAPYVGPGKLPFLGRSRPSGAADPRKPSGGAPYVGPRERPALVRGHRGLSGGRRLLAHRIALGRGQCSWAEQRAAAAPCPQRDAAARLRRLNRSAPGGLEAFRRRAYGSPTKWLMGRMERTRTFFSGTYIAATRERLGLCLFVLCVRFVMVCLASFVLWSTAV